MVVCYFGLLGFSGKALIKGLLGSPLQEPRWLKFNDDTVSSVDIHQDSRFRGLGVLGRRGLGFRVCPAWISIRTCRDIAQL